MRLVPAQKNFHLYETGFEGDDLFERRGAGQRLSELLEKVEDPVVVALDGPWGSGKSHFLKRWVAAHAKENDGTATTVYFDSFANDFLDDPLISLTAAIGDRLPKGPQANRWRTAKNLAALLARPALRIGAAAITAGITEYTSALADATLEATGKEADAVAEAFWRREDGRKAAMQQFHAALAQLTQPSESAPDRVPIIVVIDELDRCRPDYALATLEVIKHFFSVDRVHFVLGVNLDALEHIVRVRYGAGVDANAYLKRFISLSMHLPEVVKSDSVPIRYFSHCASQMGIDQKLTESVSDHLSLAASPSGISLRDIEKILTNLVLLPKRAELEGYRDGWKDIVVSVVLIRTMRPDLFAKVRDGTIDIADVRTFYGIKSSMIDPRDVRKSLSKNAFIVNGCWSYLLGDDSMSEDMVRTFSKAFGVFNRSEAGGILPAVIDNFFGLFSVPE